jgi:hypothetical protein
MAPSGERDVDKMKGGDSVTPLSEGMEAEISQFIPKEWAREGRLTQVVP